MSGTLRPLVALAAWTLPLFLYCPTWAHSNDDDQRLRACVSALSQTLARQLSERDYPQDLQESQTQGTVLVELSLDRSGRLRDGALAKTSGYAALDQAAVRALQRVFPRSSAAPAECRLEAEFLVTLPLRFELRVVQHKR
jgi:protein TonB